LKSQQVNKELNLLLLLLLLFKAPRRIAP